jgi:subtilisin family serine protease
MKKILLTGLLAALYFTSYAQKKNWQHLDLVKDTIFGISTDRAYNELLKGNKPKPVIVGIVDSGVDTLQEDLKSVIWIDPKTRHHGWNYIGPETGREDITNLVGNKKALYDSLAYTTVPETYRRGYQQYRMLVPQLEEKRKDMQFLVNELEVYEKLADQLIQNLGKANPTLAELKSYQPKSDDEKVFVQRIVRRMQFYSDWKTYRYREITHILNLAKYHLAHGLNIDNQEADTAKGNFDISPDKLGPVSSPNLTAYHGTHVSGIIGAVRGNGIGMDGVADNVKILMLKENGTIREMRDDALARAIHFAVDHGAKVINLSFGKPYAWDKRGVDAAVKYAMKKDVLIIHAAGNNGEDIDKEEHYPNPNFLNGDKANNWIEVGASGPKNDSTVCANFSNYGEKDVDVFAPGVDIYSTLPYNQYQYFSGTSMAAPVVTGLAALIREYYPKLSAVQVKEIIIKSVVTSKYLTNKCVSGGVVNAYNALKLAATYKKESAFTFNSSMGTSGL